MDSRLELRFYPKILQVQSKDKAHTLSLQEKLRSAIRIIDMELIHFTLLIS